MEAMKHNISSNLGQEDLQQAQVELEAYDKCPAMEILEKAKREQEIAQKIREILGAQPTEVKS